MPTISTFFGISVRMFYNDHPPPHYHVAYGSHRAIVAIGSGALLHGFLPAGALRVVREWAGRHEAELLENWERARMKAPLERIQGADQE
ncbi:MAG TPA: DUF4160 domain-containing protein [Mesorhizobium sp.]|jgi:hypothetical protein|nr:DUF4160 domain-containing protein [Mesorhizobium sp.]